MNTSTYWNNEGNYQVQYDELKKLIPLEGKAPTQKLELLRVATNMYYDVYNNGGMNACRFTETLQILESHPNWGEAFGSTDAGIFKSWLEKAANKQEDYLLSIEPTPAEEKFYELLEQFIDWVIEAQ